MSDRVAKLACLLSLSLTCLGQSTLVLQNPTDAPLGARANSQNDDERSQAERNGTGQQSPKVVVHLSLRDA